MPNYPTAPSAFHDPGRQHNGPDRRPMREVFIPPPRASLAPLPLLSLNQSADRTVLTLSQALVTAIPGFGIGSSMDLVVPSQRGGAWYLDTAPKPGQGTHLPGNPREGKYQVRVPRISPTHFLTPRPTACKDAHGKVTANRNHIERTGKLCFRLGEEVAGHPGYYALHTCPAG